MTKDRMMREAEVRYESYLNGNYTQLMTWIGNSATRLLVVYTVAVVSGGSNMGRLLMDSVRNYKHICV